MANFIANVKAVLDDSELIKLDNLCNKERTANVKIKLSGDINQLDNVNRSIEDIRNNARSPIQLSLNAGQVVTQLNAIEAQLLRIQAIHLNLGGNGRTRNANNEITRQYNNAMNLQRRMAKQQKALFSLDLDRDNNQFNTYFTQLNRLQADYNDIISDFGNAFSDEQNRRLQLVGAELAEQIQQIQAKLQDTIAKNLSDGKYSDALRSLESKFNSIQNPTNTLRQNLTSVSDSIYEMQQAVDSGDFDALLMHFNNFNHNLVEAKNNINAVVDSEKLLKRQQAEQQRTQDRYDSITKAGRFGEFDLEFDDLENSLNQIREIEPKLSNAFNNLSQAKKQFDDTLRQSPNDIERVLSDYQRYQNAVEKFNAEYNKAKHGQDNDDSTKNLQRRKDRLDYQMNSWLKDNSAAVKKYGKNIDDLRSKIQSCNDAQLDKIEKEFEDIDFAAKKAGLATQSFGDKLKAGITDEFTQLFSISRLFDYGVDAIRDMYDNVVEVDSAMINLKKVTDETDATYNKFIDTSADTAIALGRSMSSYIEQTADWTKLGYTLKEAEGLAKLSSVYANVAEIDDATAVSDMVTAMKAFNIETSNAIQITDALNELGNRFATDAGSLGSGLTKAAASMSNAGADLNQTLAMLTGGAEITQNATEFGNFLKTASMRIRGMKGELEELGEEVDPTVDSISKVQTQILNITKNTSKPINIFDDSGNFRNYYTIMEEIASIYNELTSTNQAKLDEILFGKVRANQGAALIKAFQSGQIQKAYATAVGSEGSAMAEQEKWMESLQAKMASFEAAWQHLSTSVMSSELLGGLIDFGTGAVEFFADLVDGVGALNTALLGAGITGFFWNLD